MCTASAAGAIPPGPASWSVLTWNAVGYGPWSDSKEFSVDIADPSVAAPVPSQPQRVCHRIDSNVHVDGRRRRDIVSLGDSAQWWGRSVLVVFACRRRLCVDESVCGCAADSPPERHRGMAGAGLDAKRTQQLEYIGIVSRGYSSPGRACAVRANGCRQCLSDIRLARVG